MSIFVVKAYFNKKSDKILRACVYDTSNGYSEMLDCDTITKLIRGGFVIDNIEIENQKDINISTGNTRYFDHLDQSNYYINTYAYLLDKQSDYYRIVVGLLNKQKYIDTNGTFDELDDIFNIKENKLMFGNAMICGNKKQGYSIEYLKSYMNDNLQNTIDSQFQKTASTVKKLNEQGFIIKIKELPQGKCITHLEHYKGIGEFQLPKDTVYLGKVNGGINKLLIPSSVKYLASGCCERLEDLYEIALSKNSQISIIPDYAFTSSRLKKISGIQKITEVGIQAFFDTKLKDVLNMQSVQKIKKEAFRLTSIKEIILPNIEYINSGAFRDCYKLENIKFGDSLKIIGAYAFTDDNNLKSIKMSKNIKLIKQYAFHGCNNLKTIKISRETQLEKFAIPKKTKIIYID